MGGKEIRERRRTQKEDTKNTEREEVITYRMVMSGGKLNIVKTETKHTFKPDTNKS